MKNTFFKVSRAAALAVCAVATSQVQAALIPSLSVSVPFDFVVSGKNLPAGSYDIVSTNTNTTGSVFVVRNKVTRTEAISMANSRSWPKGAATKSAQVVFACRDERCYIKELQIPGSDGYVVMLPKATPAQRERLVALNAGFAATGK
ncbi:MAG: hypothetical protein ABI972_30165 [Acidobacteriota bacterium]